MSTEQENEQKKIKTIKNEFYIVTEKTLDKIDGSKPHLDTLAPFFYRGYMFLLANKKTKCNDCNKLCKKRPIISWKYLKSIKQWKGKCSCGKNYLSKDFK